MQTPFLRQQDQFITLPTTSVDLAWNKNNIAILTEDKVLIYNNK
jgi:hypothetical protein